MKGGHKGRGIWREVTRGGGYEGRSREEGDMKGGHKGRGI